MPEVQRKSANNRELTMIQEKVLFKTSEIGEGAEACRSMIVLTCEIFSGKTLRPVPVHGILIYLGERAINILLVPESESRRGNESRCGNESGARRAAWRK